MLPIFVAKGGTRKTWRNAWREALPNGFADGFTKVALCLNEFKQLYIYIHIHIYINIYIYSYIQYNRNLAPPKAGHENKRKTRLIIRLHHWAQSEL